jgi:uncharacterized RDD family membrane protein YckC
MTDTQTILLRIAAFLVDALSTALILIAPSSLISYVVAWFGGSLGPINIVWFISAALLLVAMLFRDGWHGRSPGKRLLGLRLQTPTGEPCGYGRSFVRNLPVVVPGWNLVEVVMVIAGKRRTGDRLARTTVSEE